MRAGILKRIFKDIWAGRKEPLAAHSPAGHLRIFEILRHFSFAFAQKFTGTGGAIFAAASPFVCSWRYFPHLAAFGSHIKQFSPFRGRCGKFLVWKL
ncbi:MAG: hypothetical protein DBX55_04740 [Verrucomicrobia bacterium]|nr:MAG: hypothetical protein DBX55_04740 [Verrucomicrobiota bacterium]